MTKNIIISILIVVIIILPFIINDPDDGITALTLTESTVGYYQSTTCSISLFEFYSKNNSENINLYFNNNDYADVNCFGKITGVDEIKDGYFISIGTNSSANIILQSIVWLGLLFLIPKTKIKTQFSSIPVLVLPMIAILQFIGENRFYRNNNVLFENLVSVQNFYFILTFLNILLVCAVLNEILKYKFDNLLNYLPFIFLLTGTYTGNNLNMYMLFGALLGLHNIIDNYKNLKKSVFNYPDYIYFIFSIFWITNRGTSDYYFDTDKLRGFVNSSSTSLSKIYWITMFYLFVRGLIFLFNECSSRVDFSKIKNNFLLSGSLVVLFGYLGSVNPLINFFNMIIFGQNKRGMKSFLSIEGNTWRGLSPSAESIGEFFGFAILFYIVYLIDKKREFKIVDFILIIPIFYGLYRSNNFAVITSVTLLVLYFIFTQYSTEQIKQRVGSKYILFTVIFMVILFSFSYIEKDYEYLSTELIYEATLHQDFFSFENNYSNYMSIEKKMEERDLKTLLRLDENYLRASSSYLILINIFTQSFNIPLVPNIVGLISVIAFYINRTEMWGIFIAKYNPDVISGIFGFGPLQLNEYLYEHNVRLDVPSYEQSALFLPHSSFLDILLFFGLAGTCFLLLVLYNTFKNQIGVMTNTKYLLAFLVINLLKSDSVLYLNSFVLLIFTYSLTKNEDIVRLKK
jgi:hypothetical protein